VVVNDNTQKLIEPFRRHIGYSSVGNTWEQSWMTSNFSTIESLPCNKIWYFLLEYCFFLELWTWMRPQLLMGLEWYVVWDDMLSINVWNSLLFFLCNHNSFWKKSLL
jgi:hypothetical protein